LFVRMLARCLCVFIQIWSGHGNSGPSSGYIVLTVRQPLGMNVVDNNPGANYSTYMIP
jgi:hypothetical protein